jgi:hypothetical protein
VEPVTYAPDPRLVQERPGAVFPFPQVSYPSGSPLLRPLIYFSGSRGTIPRPPNFSEWVDSPHYPLVVADVHRRPGDSLFASPRHNLAAPRQTQSLAPPAQNLGPPAAGPRIHSGVFSVRLGV